MALRDWPSNVGEVRSNYRGTPILMRLGTTQVQDLRQGEMVRWSAADNGILRHVRNQSGFVGLTAESQVTNTWTGKVWLPNLSPKSGAVRIPVLIDDYTKAPL